MKRFNKIFSLLIIFFSHGFLYGGGLVKKVVEKQLKSGQEKPIFKSITQDQEEQLGQLKKQKKVLGAEEKKFLASVEKELAGVKEKIIAVEAELERDAGNEFFSKRHTILSGIRAALNDIRRAREGRLKKTEDHIKLLEKAIQDPDFIAYKRELKLHAGPYSFEDLENARQKVSSQGETVEQLKKRKEHLQKDLQTAQQALATTRAEHAEKRQKQETLAQPLGAEETSKELFGLSADQKIELVSIEIQRAEKRERRAEAAVQERETELALVTFELSLELARLKELERMLRKIKTSIIVTADQLQVAHAALEKQKQTMAAIKAQYNEQINGISRKRNKDETKLEELSKRSGITADKALTDWVKDPRETVESYLGLYGVGVLDAYIQQLEAQEKNLEAKIKFESIKVDYASLLAAVKESYYKIALRKFVAEEQIAQEINSYSTKAAEIKTKIKSYTAKQDETNATITKLQNEVLERLRVRRADVQQKRNTLFKGHTKEFGRVVSLITEAEKHIDERIKALRDTSKIYGNIIGLLTKKLAHNSFILGELESITIWYRPEYAISWQGIQQILPDLQHFLSDVQTYLAQASVYRLVGTIRDSFRQPFQFLFFLLNIAFLLLLFGGIRLYLPGIEQKVLSVQTDHSGMRIFLLAISLLLGLVARYFVLIAVWVGAFALLKFYAISDHYVYILFYLGSIPYVLYLCNRCIRYFTSFNARHDYVFLTQEFQHRFIIIASTLLYATTAVVFFREAFILAQYHRSELPTILLAINFIILQISLIFLISKEQIVSIIPAKPEVWTWARELIDRYFYLILLFVITVIVMSNPYVGYGRLVLYILSGLLYTTALVRLLFWGHKWFKRGASHIFFSHRADMVRERFTNAKTWYGLSIILSFLLFAFIGFVFGAKIWDWPIAFSDVFVLLQEPLLLKGTTSPITLISVFQLIVFILSGFFTAFCINRFVLKKTFDLMLVDSGVQHAAASITRYLIVFAAILLGFQSVGLGGLVTYFAAVLIGLGFIIKEPLSDLFAYFIILVQRPVKIGDYIKLDEETGGVVRKITPKSVMLRRKNSTTIVVPNSSFISKAIINWNYTRNFIAFNDIIITISYNEDPAKVKEVLTGIVDAHPNVLKNPKPIIRLDDFGEYGFKFMVRGFLSSTYTLDQWDIASDIRFEIVKTLHEHKIKIALPVRVLVGDAAPKKLTD